MRLFQASTDRRIVEGDCLLEMAKMEPDTFDAIVSDPPYGLGFMGKSWDTFKVGDIAMRRNPEMNAVNTGQSKQGGRQRAGVDYQKRQAGDMRAFQDYMTAWAEAALRVAKPGAHLLAFGGTRTHHRLMVAIEDAGWEIRDCLMFMFGVGFPKSLDVRKAGQKSGLYCACESKAEHDVRSVRDADVSSAVQPQATIRQVLQQSMPESGASEHGSTRGTSLWGSESGVEGWSHAQATEGQLHGRAVRQGADVGAADGAEGRLHHGASSRDGRDVPTSLAAFGSGASQEPRSIEQQPVESRVVADERRTQSGGVWPLCERCGKSIVPAGLGTSLKPAYEPIILARKPLRGTVAANVQAYGTGAINVDACRIDATASPVTSAGGRQTTAMGYHGGTAVDGSFATEAHASGRWPANVILDTDSAAILDAQTGERKSGVAVNRNRDGSDDRNPEGACYGKYANIATADVGYGDNGGASRFFKVVSRGEGDTMDGCASHEHARSAADRSSQSSGRAGSVQSPALTASGQTEPGTRSRSINAKQTESSERDAIGTLPIPNTESGCLQESMQPSTADRRNRAENAEQAEQTGTTTTTTSHCSSCGCVVPATSDDTLRSVDHGVLGSPSGSRFMYTAKASSAERNDWIPTGDKNAHPTVKPVDLMRWCIRLVTPLGGHVLDPFCGSGSTGVAAGFEGMEFTGIELDPVSAETARQRLGLK